MLVLLALLFSSVLAAPATTEEHQLVITQEYMSLMDLGSDPVVRVKREAATVCKYRKGEWSSCEPLTQLVTREDTLKTKSSPPECGPTRTLTKHCQGEGTGKHVTCNFQKSKTVPWTDCLPSGVRQKVLDLVSPHAEGPCPRQKLLSRKCKDGKKVKQEKEKKKKRDKKETQADRKAERKAERKAVKESKKAEKETSKCQFGDWGSWTTCRDGKSSRTREVTTGGERLACQRKATTNKDC